VGTPLRIDPEQRFTCSQCGRCCYRWDVFVTDAEIASYRRANAASWFREAREAAEDTARDLSTEAQGAKVEPFEPMPGWPGLHRIRKRDDGGCGFLSPENRCRLHEELGADRKPLTCRMFPYTLHPAPDAVVVTASFGCPTIAANQGQPIASGAGAAAIDALRQEWFGTRSTTAAPRELVKGRPIDSRSLRVLREHLVAIWKTDAPDIGTNLRRIATVLDDLTRRRVLSLPAADFAEYITLTLPYAASNAAVPAPRPASRIGRLLQYGFLYAVAATRLAAERREQSRARIRLARIQLLAHFHRLAPGVDRLDVGALARGSVDLNAPEIRPIVFHYVRSTLESLGGRDRPIVDDLAISLSYLNAARALAVMNAAASGRAVERQLFIDALMDAVLMSHTDQRGLIEHILRRLAGGTEAIWSLQSSD
jgi:Fe-S-cluster containining protein